MFQGIKLNLLVLCNVVLTEKGHFTDQILGSEKLLEVFFAVFLHNFASKIRVWARFFVLTVYLRCIFNKGFASVPFLFVLPLAMSNSRDNRENKVALQRGRLRLKGFFFFFLEKKELKIKRIDR